MYCVQSSGRMVFMKHSVLGIVLHCRYAIHNAGIAVTQKRLKYCNKCVIKLCKGVCVKARDSLLLAHVFIEYFITYQIFSHILMRTHFAFMNHKN